MRYAHIIILLTLLGGDQLSDRLVCGSIPWAAATILQIEAQPPWPELGCVRSPISKLGHLAYVTILILFGIFDA